MRLDAHQFFSPEHPPDHLAPILKRNRFDGSIAIAQSPADTKRLFELAPQCDFLKGVVVCAGADELDRWRNQPRFAGVVADALNLRAAAERQVPVDLQCPAVEVPPLVDRHPSLRIALVHLGLPDGSDAWFRAMEQLAQSPNVYCKASGLITRFPRPWKAANFRPYVQHALSVFGPQRVMFGSDWPACLPESIWKETLAAFTQAIGPQSVDVRERLLGGTAREFYGIGPGPAGEA